MEKSKNIERNSPLEAALFDHGRSLRQQAPPGEAPAASPVSEADLDAIVALVEGRMAPSQAKAFRKRLTREPALQTAMADFTLTVRRTDYARIWLETGTADASADVAHVSTSAAQRQSAASGRSVVARLLSALARPIVALPLAAGAAAVIFAAVVVGPQILDRSQAGAQTRRLDDRMVALNRAVDDGDLQSARLGYRDILAQHGVPEPVRQVAQRQFETITQIECNQLLGGSRFDQAAQVAEDALKVIPNQSTILAQAADARLLGLKQRQAAWAQVQPGIVVPPMMGMVQPAGANAYQDPAARQELSQIMGYYTRASELDPRNVRALVGQSEVYLDMGDTARAGQILGQAKTVAPGDARVQNALGRLFANRGEPDLARDAFLRALQSDPHCKPAQYNLDILFGAAQSGAARPGNIQPSAPQSGATPSHIGQINIGQPGDGHVGAPAAGVPGNPLYGSSPYFPSASGHPSLPVPVNPLAPTPGGAATPSSVYPYFPPTTPALPTPSSGGMYQPYPGLGVPALPAGTTPSAPPAPAGGAVRGSLAP